MSDESRLSRAWPSMVALLGTVGVVVALLFLFGDDVPTPNAAEPSRLSTTSPAGASPTGEQQSTPPAQATPVPAPPELRTPVAILNSTSVAGLAAGAQQRMEAEGWEVPAIDDYSRELTETTIFYPDDSLLPSAEALTAQFPAIRRVEPTIAGLTRDRMVLILGTDWAEQFGDEGASGDTG